MGGSGGERRVKYSGWAEGWRIYVFTFLVTFLMYCFRWSPQPPFGVGLGRSGGPLGGLLVPLGVIWNDFGVFWGVSGSWFGVPSGNVKSSVFLCVFNGFQGLEGVRI